jgi:hypothetical protein
MNAFGGGLWFIPLVIFLGALYSYYRGYKQSKSGSLEEGETSGSTKESDTNIPFYKCPATIYGYILTVISIVVFFAIKSEA